MSIEHPSQHKFNKVKKYKSGGQHFGITCDGCQNGVIIGPRYHCQQCKDYDLGLGCFQRAKTIHSESHTFSLIPDPVIRCSNRLLLAQRALEWFTRQNSSNNNQREPLTGWTKKDAEQIIQIENQFYQEYKQTEQREAQKQLDRERNIQQIQRQTDEIKWYNQKQELEHQRKMIDMQIETNKKLQEMHLDLQSPRPYRYYY